MAVTLGLPSVSVPVLSTTSVSIFSMRSSASAFLIRMPACAARPTPTMIDIGVASPSAQGQAMISTRHGGDQRVSQARLRPERRPSRECDQRRRDHRRHEPGGDPIGQPLDRRARALRRGDHLHDLRQHGVAADFFRAHDEAAAAVERSGDHVGALLLGHRHRFAGDHRFIDRGPAFDQHAIDRNLFAGTNAQPVAGRNGLERHIFIAAVILDAPRGLGRQLDKRADRARGRGAGAQFEHLAEQHQHGDDARRPRNKARCRRAHRETPREKGRARSAATML